MLITVTEIKKYVDISDNINVERKVNPQIKLAQDLDLEPFLGNRLLNAFSVAIADPESPDFAIYEKLLQGETYTYEDYQYSYEGIEPALAWYSYARMLANNSVMATATGVVFKLQRDSDPVDEKSLQRLIGNAQSTAFAYLQKSKIYLDRFYTTYPLWRDSPYCGCGRDNFRRSGAHISAL